MLVLGTSNKENLQSQGKLAIVSANMSAIRRAIRQCGGVTGLAKNLKVSYQAVQQWQRADRVPAERVIGIERATAGKVSRQDLRPDLYPKETRRPESRP